MLKSRIHRLAWGALALAPCLCCSAGLALAAPGERDPSFGRGGIVRVDADPAANNAEDRIEIDANGRYVVLATDESGTSRLLRFGVTGTLDHSFGHDGSATVPGGTWHDLALQTDGGIVLAGTASDSFAVTRFDAAGNVDADFGSGGLMTTHVDPARPVNSNEEARQALERIELRANGRIVAIGNVRSCYGGSEPGCSPRGTLVVGYTPNGNLDPGFGNEGVVALNVSRVPSGLAPYALGTFHSLALQPNGAILIGGTTGRDMVLVRLTPNGALDPSFSTDGVVISGRDTSTDYEGIGSLGDAGAIVLQDDGRIVAIGGDVLVALRPNGSVDTRFGSKGSALVDSIDTTNLDLNPRDATVDRKGRILVAGGTGSLTAVMRFFPNGRHDPRFAGDGLAHVNLSKTYLDSTTPEEAATGIALEPDGSPVTAGFAFSGEHGELVLTRFRGGDGRLAHCKGKAAILQGTPQADRLSASGGPIVAFGGDDEIHSYGGLICAGAGDDHVNSPNYGAIYSGAGDDTITGNDRGPAYGGAGDDTIRTHRGYEGSDSYFGGPGHDLLTGGKGPDRLFGGSGPDRLLGDGGKDRLVGGAGNDLLSGGSGTDRIATGGGKDRVFPGADSPPEAIYEMRRAGFKIRLTLRKHRVAGVHISVRNRCSDGHRSNASFNTNHFNVHIDRHGRFRYRSSDTYDGSYETLLAGRVMADWIFGVYSERDEYEHVLCTTGHRKHSKLRFRAHRVRH